MEAARVAAAEAGLAGGLGVAASREEMVTLVAGALRAGDNVWVDCSPVAAGGAAVLYFRFWSDPSHERVG